MGRPREFDMDDVLDRAMRAFWATGYEGTSLDDLLAAMGIKRGSLYKAFTDKRALYQAALRHYDASVVDAAVGMLRARDDDGRTRISRFLHSVADATERGVDPPGCFLCNAIVDQAPHDPETGAAVSQSLTRLESAFEIALDDLPVAMERLARADLARRLVADYVGMRVLARAGRDAAALHRLAEAVLTSLPHPGAGHRYRRTG